MHPILSSSRFKESRSIHTTSAGSQRRFYSEAFGSSAAAAAAGAGAAAGSDVSLGSAAGSLACSVSEEVQRVCDG